MMCASARTVTRWPLATPQRVHATSGSPPSRANVAARMEKAGAAGVVLFNRFVQPDISLDRLAPQVGLNLSTPAEALLPLRWIGLLHGRVGADLAASGGVHDAGGAAKMILAGATVVQLASALLRNGVPHLGRIRRDLEDWMDRRGFGTLDDFRGSLSQRQVQDPSAYERAQYVQLILSQNT